MAYLNINGSLPFSSLQRHPDYIRNPLLRSQWSELFEHKTKLYSIFTFTLFLIKLI